MNLLGRLIAILTSCMGPDQAVTLENLANILAVSRREVEQLIEENLGHFPFVLIAGSEGLYRPTEAGQINAYLHNLHSRHHKMAMREETVRRKAASSGWNQDETGLFRAPAGDPQLALF